MRNRFLPVSGLTLGVLLIVSSGVKADNYQTNFTTSSTTAVNILYTNPSSLSQTSSVEGTWAVPFTMKDTTTNATFQAFCIDLYHNVSNGETTTNNPGFVNVAGAQGFGVTSTGTTGSPIPNYSAYPTDFGSKLNYLGYVYNQIETIASGAYKSDAYLLGAVQLAVWTLLDKNFVASGEAAGMATDLANILKLVGGTNANGSALLHPSNDFVLVGGSTVNLSSDFTAYSTTQPGNYASEGGQVLVVHTNLNDGGGTTVQNVITWGNNFTTQSVVPEPSTMAIAGLGALGMIGYGWKRRKRA
jgi:hypothetical protein